MAVKRRATTVIITGGLTLDRMGVEFRLFPLSLPKRLQLEGSGSGREASASLVGDRHHPHHTTSAGAARG